MKRHAYIFIAILGGSFAGYLLSTETEVKLEETKVKLDRFNKAMQHRIEVLTEFSKVAKFLERLDRSEKREIEQKLLQRDEASAQDDETKLSSRITDLDRELHEINHVIEAVNNWKRKFEEDVFVHNTMYKTVHQIIDLCDEESSKGAKVFDARASASYNLILLETYFKFKDFLTRNDENE